MSISLSPEAKAIRLTYPPPEGGDTFGQLPPSGGLNDGRWVLTPGGKVHAHIACALPSVLFALLIVLLTAAASSVQAYQAAPGMICVLTFTDTNQNGLHEPSEPLLNGVNVSLAEGGLMIANHLSDNQGQYCFQNLAPGAYTLTFSDPLAQPTTATTLTLTLNTGDQLTRAFGAVPISNTSQVSTPHGLVIPLTHAGRLLLAAFGAGIVMLFTIGVGLIGYSFYRLRRNAPTK
ncbi:MAG: SdrD B-like domain-containing protein [Aggregatilineales bacterium]